MLACASAHAAWHRSAFSEAIVEPRASTRRSRAAPEDSSGGARALHLRRMLQLPARRRAAQQNRLVTHRRNTARLSRRLLGQPWMVRSLFIEPMDLAPGRVCPRDGAERVLYAANRDQWQYGNASVPIRRYRARDCGRPYDAAARRGHRACEAGGRGIAQAQLSLSAHMLRTAGDQSLIVLVAIYENGLVAKIGAGENNGHQIRYDYTVRKIVPAFELNRQGWLRAGERTQCRPRSVMETRPSRRGGIHPGREFAGDRRRRRAISDR